LTLRGDLNTHDYWDFGTVDGRRYSYARDVAARGFPTFAFDEIGSGNSSHPPSTRVSSPFRDMSSASRLNRRLQVADAVAWSSAFVGQRKFDNSHDLDERGGFFEGLPWNDNLPCNCGGIH
jgi:hypothetical protein